MRWTCALAPVALVVSLSAPALAAPGYSYELIAESEFSALEQLCTGHAINDRGDVAYQTNETLQSGHSRVRVYVKPRGLAAQLVYQEDTNGQSDPTPVPIQCNSLPNALGINEDGIVSLPVQWVDVDANGNVTAFNDYGYALIEPGVGIIRQMRDLWDSSGRVTQGLRVAGATSLGRPDELLTTDGVTTTSVSIPGGSLGGFLRELNESGDLAVVGIAGSASGFFLQRFAPPSTLWNSSVGRNAIDSRLTSVSVALNDANWVSLATTPVDFASGPIPRVVAIDPVGTIFPISQGSDPGFETFLGATAINAFNRVAFTADTVEDGVDSGIADSLWVGDPSGAASRRVADQTEVLTLGGRDVQLVLLGSGIYELNTHSINDAGEIAFHSGFYETPAAGGGQFRGLIVARPDPGTEPGSPVLPPPGSGLPGGGWLLPNCPWIQSGLPCWVDPPVAAGYEYTLTNPAPTAFTSVIVPVPLPGGDASFSVEWQGGSAPITAGTIFDFTSAVPGGVRQFRITGIDLLEALDPTDPAAFVVGLTFASPPPAGAQLTVVPLVENTDDFDQDGVIASQDNCPSVANAGQENGDTDGVGDACDNCVYAANASQSDVGGVGAAFGADGIGDACQCGDVSGDGRVTTADATIVTRSLLVPPTASLAQPAQCNVGGNASCTTADAVIITRALLVPPTASVQQVCAPALPGLPPL